MAYRIVDWDKHYESSNSRRIKGALNWVQLVTKHDGKRYKRLTRMPRGIEHFGAFVVIVQVAAKMPERGLLVDDKGHALTTEDLEDMTGWPREVFDNAFSALLSDRIGWIETVGEEQAPKAEESAEPEEVKKPTSKKQEEPAEIPAAIDTDQFRAKWDEWYAFRRTNNWKKYKPATAKRQLKKLAEIGEAAAIQTLEHSMGNGYQGLFPEKHGNAKPARKPEPSERPTDTEANTW